MDYRRIYEKHHGSIPVDEKGRTFDVHHIDGDRSNNDISNLVALSIEDHFEVHHEQGDYIACWYISERMGRGAEYTMDPSLRKYLSERMKGDANPSRKAAGENHWIAGKIVVFDERGQRIVASTDDPKVLSGEWSHVNKGMTLAKDKDGNILRVSVKDSRYISGELVHHSKGMITVKDKDGNTMRVSKEDPRYLSGELVAHRKGIKITLTDGEKEKRYAHRRGLPPSNKGKTGIYKMSDESKSKISEANKGKKKPTVICNYCGKEGGKPVMTRYHFENCKDKQ